MRTIVRQRRRRRMKTMKTKKKSTRKMKRVKKEMRGVNSTKKASPWRGAIPSTAWS